MKLKWWQSGVVYQVYPRSFMDANGDGVGDLEGVRQRLEHLVRLGVDAIWISPIYPSPMADFGYDVADYVDVHPLFGSLADFDRLLADAHARGIRVLLDYVPNHTSERHPWFVESRASRSSKRRDWYFWRDPAPGGGPPNNWLSEFGGPAWTLDPSTGQYYLHTYLKEQPDLDWRNPAVRDAMLDVLRFWFARGVDGFRLDALSHVLKDPALRDNPENPDWRPEMGPYKRLLPVHSNDLADVHEVLRAMRAVADEFEDRVLIGELYLPLPQLMRYYGPAGDEVHLPTNFQLIKLPWRAPVLGQAIEAYEAALPATAWPNWVLGNHDKSRVASRVGAAQARVAAMLLLTLRGTPTIYYGDEIGMEDAVIPPDRVQDPFEINVPGLGLGRDPERAPLAWSDAPHGGFSTTEPWLPLVADWRTTNVAAQERDPASMLALHRALIALRRAEPAFTAGRIDILSAATRRESIATDVLAYTRTHAGRRFLVALNLGHGTREVALGVAGTEARVRLSTRPAPPDVIDPTRFVLRPDEGLVALLV